MKNKLLLFVLTLFIINVNYGQGMEKGTNFLSLGVGPSANYYSYHSGGTPAIRFAYDHGFKKAGPGVISLGGAIGFFTKYYKGYTTYQFQGYYYTQHWTYVSATFRAGYYYNFGKLIKAPELNAYAGIGTGVLQRFYSYDGSHQYSSAYEGGTDIQFNFYFGANYFFTKKFGLYTEFGYDISYATVGMTFNL